MFAYCKMNEVFYICCVASVYLLVLSHAGFAGQHSTETDKYTWDMVESMPFDRRVVGLNPALAAT